MAIRNIRLIGDEILTRKSKYVKEMNERISTLIDDMLETMYDAAGVGLAAPQVGVLKRIVVIDVTEEGNSPMVLINPEILEEQGEVTDNEGCLSVPGKVGKVTRPEYVKIKALDRDMQPVEYEGNGLLARAFVHEIEHLDGKLYVDKVEGGLIDVTGQEEG